MKRPEEAKRHHAAAMFAWEKQIATDASLGRYQLAAAGISVILRDKMRHSGETPPIDQKWLAKQVGCCVRTVQRVLDALVKAGHLGVISGKSKGVANRYRAIIKEKAKSQPVGYDSGVVGGTTQESEGVRLRSRTSTHRSYSLTDSWKSAASAAQTCCDSDGSAKKKGDFDAQRHMDGAVAERRVSERLGPHGYEILGVLQETEHGRGLYERLIASTQSGGVRRHLLEEARRMYIESKRCVGM